MRAAVDAEAREGGGERVDGGERMPSARDGAGSGEIVRQAGVHRARHVAVAILQAAPVVVREIESAVDNRPVAQVLLEKLRRNERRVDHGDSGAVIW
ncbi:hypothetical protein D3C83_27000 [compost metagenome]